MTKRERTRDAILQTAVEMASSRGLEALTIGDLADCAGLSKSGLYAHFDSKEGLQLAIVDRIFDDFRRRVVDPASRVEPGLRPLRAFELWVAWSVAPDHPGGCPMLSAIFDTDARQGPVRAAVAAGWRAWRRHLSDLFQQAGLPAPEAQADSLLAAYLQQHVARWLLGEHDAPSIAVDRVRDQLSPGAATKA